MAGMHLTRVDDGSENAWIRSASGFEAWMELWIGAEDPTQMLVWQWPDGAPFWTGTDTGSSVGGLYSAWGAGYPTGKPNRQCASMLADTTWFDRSCTSLLPYVCELY